MADAKKCDLCGEFYDTYPVVRKIYRKVDGYSKEINVDTRAYRSSADALDLCRACATELMVDVSKDLISE